MADCNRKRKNPSDVNDYFEANESDIGEIKVETDTGEIISLEVKGSDTIGNIKVVIQAKTNIPFDQQELVFDKMVLENINTLANLRVKKQSTLTLMRRTEESMEVYVNTVARKTISMLVKPTDTVIYMKTQIQLKTSIHWSQQVLIFNKMVLDDNETLFNCHINRKSTLTVMSRTRGSLQIFSKIFINIGDETITLEVKPSDTVGNIKAKIQGKAGIPSNEQELVFNETVLDNSDVLADCNINTGSTLTLMRVLTTYMCIFIKNQLASKTFSLKVKPSDTVHNVKSKIHDKDGIPPYQQRLVWSRMELNDSATLADYHIPKESTVYLDFILRGGM